MFGINAGWLTYEPFEHYKLPEIVRMGDTAQSGEAVFSKWQLNKQKKEQFRLPMYRLQWPGRMGEPWHPDDDTISHEILQNWGIRVGAPSPRHSDDPPVGSIFLPNKPCSLKWMVDNGFTFPKRLPSTIAYHLAVNRDLYWPPPGGLPPDLSVYHPIGALPKTRVGQVLNARFALDGKHFATLQYLKWLAEGHYMHPLFRGFDTMIREMLMGVSHKAAQLYFKLLGDCLYNPVAEYWERQDFKHHWFRLAGYVHYLDRTGYGLVHLRDFSDLERGWDGHPEMEDVRLGFKEWEKVRDDVHGMAHVTGKMPGVAGDEPSIGPVIEEREEFPFEEDLLKLMATFNGKSPAAAEGAWREMLRASKDHNFDLVAFVTYAQSLRNRPEEDYGEGPGQRVEDLEPVVRIRAPSGAAKKGRTLVEDPFGEDLVALAQQFEHGEPDESMEAWTVLTQRSKDEEFVLRDLFNYAREIPVEEPPVSANPQTAPE